MVALAVVDAPAGQMLAVSVEVIVATFVTVDVLLPVTVLVLVAVTVLLFVAMMSTSTLEDEVSIIQTGNTCSEVYSPTGDCFRVATDRSLISLFNLAPAIVPLRSLYVARTARVGRAACLGRVGRLSCAATRRLTFDVAIRAHRDKPRRC